METDIMERSYTQKEWTELIEQILTYLSETEGANAATNTSTFYKTERQVLPSNFLSSPLCHFCYTFRGVFLPSGNMDGIVWKPSQGAKPSGKNLMKRYFYFKKDNLKINRQVIWLTHNENWCFLDYRYNFKGKIKLKDISIPEGFNFKGLIMAATNGGTLLSGIPSIPYAASLTGPLSYNKRHRHDDIKEEDEEDDENTLTTASSHYIPKLLPATDFDSKYPLEGATYTDYNDSLFAEKTFEESDLFLSNIDLDFAGKLSNPPTLASYLDFDEDESSKKRAKVAEEENTVSTTQSSGYGFGTWDWMYPSNIFSSGVEYFFDMISHLICNQLLFQRRFFQQYNVDSELALQRVKQSYITFDLREWPGNIFKSFFEWISETYFHLNTSELPTIYCLVCGNDVKHHDEAKHKDFFLQLDSSFAQLLQEKAGNMYELIKQYIIFLLRNPSSHEFLKTFISENLHCPFCSGTHGNHNAHKHKKWAQLWKIDPSHTAEVKGPPSPSSNIYDYTKSTFEWLVDQVPFYIPPFLLSFHYVKYVRTFMECLVTCWNSVRLLV